MTKLTLILYLNKQIKDVSLRSRLDTDFKHTQNP